LLAGRQRIFVFAFLGDAVGNEVDEVIAREPGLRERRDGG